MSDSKDLALVEETTAIAIPGVEAPEDFDKIQTPALFTPGFNKDGFVEQIRKIVLAHEFDVETVEGRKAARSLAYKVAQLKGRIERTGLALTEEVRARVQEVTEYRASITAALDDVRDEAKAAAVAWDAKDAERKEAIQERMVALGMPDLPPEPSAEVVRVALEAVKAIEVDHSFEEFQDDAIVVKSATITKLHEILSVARDREERLRQHQRILDEQERLLQAQKEAAAELAEAKAETQRLKDEAERKEREQKEAEEARERAVEEERQRAAQKKAEEEAEKERLAEAAEAEKKRLAKVAEDARLQALQEAEEARLAKVEEERLAKERADQEAEARRRDFENRARVRSVISEAIKDKTLAEIVDDLMLDKVPHCTVTF